MLERLTRASDAIIHYCFYALIFATPLLLTPFNYELFEFNKMMFVYAVTAIITSAWIIKMIAYKEFRIVRTPLDIPLLLFLLVLLASTFFSIDRHVSIWGYYSRFNGGLLSIISYLILYYAFVTNFPKEKILTLLKIALACAVIVSLYGIAEHFGIDKHIWVQDVQNRVFSTLGQPNWLAAYLAIILPIISSFSIVPIFKYLIERKKRGDFFPLELFVIWLLMNIFYLTLLFTKSRSGFLGFWVGNTVFWIIQSYKLGLRVITGLMPVLLNISFLLLTFLIGSPFFQLNRFTLPELTKSSQPTSQNPQPITNNGGSLIDVGITESGTIRNIVWKGAIDIIRHYPLLGTGPETFAFSYYKFRPVEHNMTSEWDFLYNKAHNEFLNYSATTGLLGLGSYLLIIGTFVIWIIRRISNFIPIKSGLISNQIQISKSKNLNLQLTAHNPPLLILALFSGWLTIHITNFFGFSVVITQLFFYLIPAISFVLSKETHNQQQTTNNKSLDAWQKILMLFVLCSMFYILFTLGRFWYADKLFASGFSDSKAQKYSQAYSSISQAISLRSDEPFFYDELTLPTALLGVAFAESGESTTSAQLITQAIQASTVAITTSPANINYWKSRTRLFYALSRLDEKYVEDARDALETAHELAPTDPKITYNLGLIYDQRNQTQESYQALQETIRLKPDYRDAYFALGLFYQRDKKPQKAKEMIEFILNRINPNDDGAKEKLEELL